MGEWRGVYRFLVGRPECKRPLGRPRWRWEDNIKMDLREIGIDGANWIRLAQDRVQWRAFVNMVMNLRVHKERGLLFCRLSDYQLLNNTLHHGVSKYKNNSQNFDCHLSDFSVRPIGASTHVETVDNICMSSDSQTPRIEIPGSNSFKFTLWGIR
jgi:hypothetical protein